KILSDKFQLLRQRDFVLANGFERETEYITQSAEHFVRSAYVLVHHCRDGVQAIEQEVRLQLVLEQQESSVCQFSFVHRVASEIVDRLRKSNDCPVSQQVGMKAEEERFSQLIRGIAGGPIKKGMAHGEQKACWNVHQQRSRPRLS